METVSIEAVSLFGLSPSNMNPYTIDTIAETEESVRFRIQHQSQYLSFAEVFDLWASDEDFIRFYVSSVRAIGYPAIYWEHPALTQAYLHKQYECIVMKSKTLPYLPVNEEAFSAHIHQPAAVVDFMNLGKNARLVVPTKQSDEEIYNHLGRFLRGATDKQIIALFRRIGNTIRAEIERQGTIWLNTAGLGVIWLHVRMDTRPKYYKTASYKQPDFLEKVG